MKCIPFIFYLRLKYGTDKINGGQRWVQSVRPSGVAVVTVVGGTLTSHPFGAGVAKYESRCIQWYLNNVWEHHYGDWELMDRLIVWLAATLAAPPLPCVISTTLHTERHITSYTSHFSPHSCHKISYRYTTNEWRVNYLAVQLHRI